MPEKMPSYWFPNQTAIVFSQILQGPDRSTLVLSSRKRNPGSNNSKVSSCLSEALLRTRIALPLVSLCGHTPCQPTLHPATEVFFLKQKQRLVTPSAYDPSTALCCLPNKSSLLRWVSLVSGSWWLPSSAPSTGLAASPNSYQLCKHECSPTLPCLAACFSPCLGYQPPSHLSYSYSVFQSLLKCASSEEGERKLTFIQDFSQAN